MTLMNARSCAPRPGNSLSLVPFDNNLCSVPVKFAHRESKIVATVDEIRLIFKN